MYNVVQAVGLPKYRTGVQTTLRETKSKRAICITQVAPMANDVGLIQKPQLLACNFVGTNCCLALKSALLVETMH